MCWKEKSRVWGSDTASGLEFSHDGSLVAMDEKELAPTISAGITPKIFSAPRRKDGVAYSFCRRPDLSILFVLRL
jgi:hypothetical protein